MHRRLYPFSLPIFSIVASLLSGCGVALPSSQTPLMSKLTQPPPPECADPKNLVCELLTGSPSYVTTKTSKVAYQKFGRGDPLVLVHGWPLNRYTWRRMLPYLAEHFTVYAIDVPGGGDTEWSNATDFTWPGQGKTMKAVVDALGITRYYLFGQDSGAVIARELALLDNAHVIKFAMANTEVPDRRPPQALIDAQAKMSMWNWAVRRTLRSKFDDPEFLQSDEGFGGSFYDRSYVLGDFRKYILTPIVIDPTHTEGHRRFLEGWDWKELDSLRLRHQQITVPVMFVWGEDDPTFPLAHAEEMSKQFPNFKGITRIAKGKLLIHEERPKEVSEALVAFFKD